MDRQYTRLDSVRFVLDTAIKAIPDEEKKRCAYVHLYGTGQAAAFLTLKRGGSRQIAELAEIAGMLHDYAKYIEGGKEDHAERSAACASTLLSELGIFSEEELGLVCHAIAAHSNKAETGSSFDEVLKDADEMQHYFRNPVEDWYFHRERVQTLLQEFGVRT